MRVTVDLSRCQGYANCVGVAPEIFDLDDASGQAVVIAPEPPRELHDAARQAVAGCPVQAISVEED
jgi:ferredoxin